VVINWIYLLPHERLDGGGGVRRQKEWRVRNKRSTRAKCGLGLVDERLQASSLAAACFARSTDYDEDDDED
jgi:hypothetical protein